MTKKQIKQIRLVIPYAIMGFVILLAGGFAFAEYQEYQAAKVVNVAGDYIEAPMEVIITEGEELGFSNPNMMSRWVRHNDLMTYIESGSFRDATNTILSIQNPFNGTPTGTDPVFNKEKYYTATATVDLIQLTITTGATTTGQILCGPSFNQYGDPGFNHLDTGGSGSFAVVTGTTGMIENNASGSYGSNVITGGSVAKSTLTHDYPWYTCKFNAEDPTSISGHENSFDGTFKLRVYKGF